ncbi:Ger(x)C family spore germination protein [Paenibacillus spiritus]|nr:Ger(x)C family spore germination protein [Paenibacillus spiritus]
MKKTWRRKAALAGILLLLPLLSGCISNYKDIDRRMFVTAIGIDPGSGGKKFRVSLKLALPQGDPTKAQERVAVLSQEADSLSETLRLLKSRVEKELDYAHCKALIIGEEQARKDILHIMDWVVRRRDMQLILNVAVGSPTAEQVLKLKPSTEQIPSNSLILSLSRQGTESPFITSVFSYRLYRNLFEPGLDPVLTIIEARGKTGFIMDRMALFDKHRSRLTLNPDEARLFNLLERKNVQTNLPARYDGKLYEYYIETSKASYRLSTGDVGRPRLTYKVSIAGILEESSGEETMTQHLLERLARESEEKLEKQFEELLRKFRDSESDPLGWGLHYGARRFDNRNEMKDWKERLPDLEIKVKVKVQIKYSGMIR